MMTKKQKEKARILKIKQQNRERGEKESIEKWDKFFMDWCGEVNKEIQKDKAKWLKECIEVFEFRGKLFEYVNLKKFEEKKWEL